MSPRYFIAAHGSGWAVHDGANPVGDPVRYPRVDFFSMTMHGCTWAEAMALAQERADELNEASVEATS